MLLTSIICNPIATEHIKSSGMKRLICKIDDYQSGMGMVSTKTSESGLGISEMTFDIAKMDVN